MKKRYKLLIAIFCIIGGLFVADYLVFSINLRTTDLENPPRFCTSDFIELYKIEKISKFRSFIGHDYSDSFESERSMKHYFDPKIEYKDEPHEIKLFSPVDGKIEYIANEQVRGKQIGIRVKDHQDFIVIIFHVDPLENISEGLAVNSGDFIGYAFVDINSNTDIAIRRDLGLFHYLFFSSRYKLYSYFQVMTNSVFSEYQKCGIESREEMIIPKEVADQRTPNWNGYPEDWVYLNHSEENRALNFELNDLDIPKNIYNKYFHFFMLDICLLTTFKKYGKIIK